MTRAAIACAGALCALAAVVEGQRFTSGAEAVRVDVLVTDGHKPVRGLTAADFEVRDTDVIQNVRQMAIEQLPLNLICVFDTSGSVAGAPLRNLLEAGRALMSGLQREDRTALLSFASRVRLHSPLTNDRPSVLRAFESLEANGTTSLRDAAFAGLVLREADPGRTLLLLFSDGADTSSWLQAPFVLETARRTDVVVYPVALAGRSTIVTRNDPAGFYGPSTQGRVIVPNTTVATREASNRFLDALAGETGGRVVRVGSDRDLKETFVAALAEFRERYMLTYVPAGVPTGGWHPLTVRLKGRSGTVRARRGYFAQ